MADLERIENGGASDLFDRVAALIEQTRASVASQANAALTMMNWQIGHLIDAEVLGEQRAGYAEEIVASLGQQLTGRYGRGYDRANLYRMIKFAQVFPDVEIVASLGQRLSWTHFKALIPVYSDEARAFYINQALDARLSVRALRELIGRQGFERREIANAQTPGGSAVPLDAFSDPYFLDFLGLKDTFRGARPGRGTDPRDGGIPPRSRQRLDLRGEAEADGCRQRRLLPRLALLLPTSASLDCGRAEGRQVPSRVQGADGSVLEVARSLRASKR
ncbi:hypothetical protein JM654_15675 [Microbacterium oxydans]|nr:hypothetical protein [Microbacterium oxydans]